MNVIGRIRIQETKKTGKYLFKNIVEPTYTSSFMISYAFSSIDIPM